MFAVPGWSVSVKPLPATPSGDIERGNPKENDEPAKARANPKKRKRNEFGSVSVPRPSSEDLQKLWNKEFETESGIRQKDSSRKKKRKPQTQSHDNQAHTTPKRKGEGTEKHHLKNAEASSQLTTVDVAQEAAGSKSKGNSKKKTAKPKRKPSSPIPTTHTPDKLRTQGQARSVHRAEIGPLGEHLQPISHNGDAKQAHLKREKSSSSPSTKLTPLQTKMRDKLTSARFRHLNQQLYTLPSSASLDLFTASPELFAAYHAGFAHQVNESWPENPVDTYIDHIRTRAQVSFKMGKQDLSGPNPPLPRRKTGSCTIADLGCGDAALARAFQSESKGLNLKFHNFDLHASNASVTKADIANLPLRDGEADVAVFCLSLMGTNWISFIEESWRVLRGDGKGELWIAEVKSRFGRSPGTGREPSVGKKQKSRKDQHLNGPNPPDGDMEIFAEDEAAQAQDGTDVSAFVDVIERRGFVVEPHSVNKNNKMFVSMSFVKTGIPSSGKHHGLKWNGREYERTAGPVSGRKKFIDVSHHEGPTFSPEQEAQVLKPCVYKKR